MFTGNKHRYDYGRIKVKNNWLLTHRVVFEHANGPTRLEVLHHCDNPPCCELSHLFEGTQADNLADMYAKGRARPRGIPLKRRTADATTG